MSSPSQSPSLLNRLADPLQSLLFPWRFMLLAASFLPATVLPLLRALDLRTLLSWSRLQPLWFGRFWAHAGPLVRADAECRVVPLLAGRVSRGRVLDPHSKPAHPPISGTVLEVGPGSGMWVSLFSPSRWPAGTGAVRKIYGIEPNAAVHPLLRAQVAAAGLQDTYEIVPVGIESLAQSCRVPRESVDCIVTVLCLCSIPNPRYNIAELYGYLKPGGRWYVYEHVKCWPEQPWLLRIYQCWCSLFPSAGR